MNERIGSWIQTYGGRQFYPFDPKVEEVHLEDIAASLSKLCRFGGHTRRFYSVAEHCVLVASKAPAELQLEALMHDAAEAYLGSDLPRPVKRNIPEYATYEARIMRVIAQRFEFAWPLAAVMELDDRILSDECQQVLATPPVPWTDRIPLGVTIHCWHPSRASYEFLMKFYDYWEARSDARRKESS